MTEINLTALSSDTKTHAPKFHIRKYFKAITVIALAFIVVLVLGALMENHPIFIVLPFLVLGILYLRQVKKRQVLRSQIEQVAKDNGWDTNKALPADTSKAAANYNLWVDMHIAADEVSQLSGTLNNLDFWLGSNNDGVFVLLDAKKNLPDAVFISSLISSGPFKPFFDNFFKAQNLSQIRLEGDFDKYFRLYTSPSRKIDVLSVVAPDFMESLIENGMILSVMFSEHYCLINTRVSTNDGIKSILVAAHAIAKELNRSGT